MMVDTREKIIGAEEARRLAAIGAATVRGYFDPMTAEHAARLASLKRPGGALLVIIGEPADPILPRRARAQLIAGLRCVDFVCDEQVAFEPQFRLESEDRERLERLIRHVQARQQAAG